MNLTSPGMFKACVCGPDLPCTTVGHVDVQEPGPVSCQALQGNIFCPVAKSCVHDCGLCAPGMSPHFAAGAECAPASVLVSWEQLGFGPAAAADSCSDPAAAGACCGLKEEIESALAACML